MRGAYNHVAPADALPEAAFAADAQMLSDAINGSKDLLEALKTGQGPDRFPWREPQGAAKGRPDSQNTEYMAHRVTLIQAREAMTDRLRVSRDPCPVCAIRADIGCQHRRVG